MSSNLDTYKGVFKRVFALGDSAQLENLQYQGIAEWDSVGHMALIAGLETEFSIELDVDDVIDFSSYKSGIELLRKYDVELA